VYVGELLLRKVCDVLVRDNDSSRVGLEKSHKDSQAYRLADAAAPHDADRLSGMTAKVTSSSTSFDPKDIEAFLRAKYGRPLSPLTNMVDCLHRSSANSFLWLSRVFFIASFPYRFGHHKLRANGRVEIIVAFRDDESWPRMRMKALRR